MVVLVCYREEAMNNQQSWDSYIEVRDWRRKKWRFNYTKHITANGWSIDWEVLAPNGSRKASGEKDSELAHRCLNESGPWSSLASRSLTHRYLERISGSVTDLRDEGKRCTKLGTSF